MKKVRKKWRRFIQLLADIPKVLRVRRLTRMPGAQSAVVESPPGTVLTNPSVAAWAGGIAVAIREVSYRVDWRGRYIPWPAAPRSRTWLGSLDVDSLQVRDLTKLSEPNKSPHLALEDPRLFAVGSSLHALWSGRDYGSGEYRSEMYLGRVQDGDICDLELVHSPYSRAVEKNWMPYLDGNDLNVVYSPSSVERYGLRSGGRTVLLGRSVAPNELSSESGSSQLVPWRGGWLGVTHTHSVLVLPLKIGAWRYYRHRFVYFASDFSYVRVSKPMIFSRRGIEFCSGLAVAGDRIIVAYGIGDRVAALASVSSSSVDSLLGPETSLEGEGE